MYEKKIRETPVTRVALQGIFFSLNQQIEVCINVAAIDVLWFLHWKWCHWASYNVYESSIIFWIEKPMEIVKFNIRCTRYGHLILINSPNSTRRATWTLDTYWT